MMAAVASATSIYNTTCSGTPALTVGVKVGECVANPQIQDNSFLNYQCIKNINCTRLYSECNNLASLNAMWECIGCNVSEFRSSWQVVDGKYQNYVGSGPTCQGSPSNTQEISVGCFPIADSGKNFCGMAYIDLSEFGSGSAASVLDSILA